MELAEAEAAIRADCDAGRWIDAATRTIQLLGPELLGFLIGIARDPVDGHDAYSELTEQVWRGLPRFRWQSSLRTWCYVVARHSLDRVRRAPHRRAGRQIALSDAPELAQAAEAIRTATVEYLRTEVKDRVAALRDQLTEPERMILALRIDRALAWRDVVRVLADDDADLTEPEMVRRAAALRKRFEVIKAKLRDAIA